MKVESFQFVDTAQAKKEQGENKLVKLDIFQSYQACVIFYIYSYGVSENTVHYV